MNPNSAISSANKGQQNASIFFRLPPELRLAVYEELLIRPKNVSGWNISTQFLRTCKLIQSEAEPILYTKVCFRVRLSVKRDDFLRPQIHVRTLIDGVPGWAITYRPGHAYRFPAWYAALRRFRCVSIAIELEKGAFADAQRAMNFSLAGLLSYIDAASDITSLHLRLLGNHGLKSSELEDLLHPVCIWGIRMSGVKLGLINISQDLRSTLLARIEFMPTIADDEIVERLFGAVRMAACAAVRLELAKSPMGVLRLNNGMATILDEVGSITPGCKLRAEAGIYAVRKLLREVLGRRMV